MSDRPSARRRWLPVAVLAGVALAGLIAVLAVAVGDRRDLALAFDVLPSKVAASVAPGQLACESPVVSPRAFAAVGFQLGTYGRPGPPLRLTVRGAGPSGSPGARRAALAAGRLPAGARDGAHVRVSTGRAVAAHRRVAVCVRNLGDHPVALYGGINADTAPTSRLTLAGRAVNSDLELTLYRPHAHSALSQLQTMLDRASLWHPGWVAPWVLWLFLALAALGAPALLALAVGALRPSSNEPEP
jgi:hypothetical protein